VTVPLIVGLYERVPAKPMEFDWTPSVPSRSIPSPRLPAFWIWGSFEPLDSLS